MKSITIILIGLLSLFVQRGIAQTNLNLGGGYFGDAVSHPGIVLDFEFEKFHAETFSAPLRTSLGFFTSPDYKVVFFDVQKGFRKQFQSGLFLEQSVGVGLLSTFYDVESIFYEDKHGNIIRYYDGANLSFMPSVSAGVGYNLTHGSGRQNSIWIRPKVYWNLVFRGLQLPYAAIQIGFTHTLKTTQK